MMRITDVAREPGVAVHDADVDLCVVVPAYNEEKNLQALYDEVSRVLDQTGVSWQFLIVDDGSRDATPDILARLRAHDERVHFLRLARNFGLQAALAAGLEHAPGKAIIIMDADLQDDPGALPAFLRAWRDGADVVYAVRTARREGWFKRLLFRSFYRIMSALSDIAMPRDAGSFALYDRSVVDAINALPERNRYLPGLRAWVGFRQVPVPVARRARHAGEPAQSFWRLLKLALDGVFAFSRMPLRAATLLGLVVTAGAAIGVLVVFYWRFVQGSFPRGIGLATIALSMLFLGGVQLLVIGIMGEYVGRIYEEVKQRPHFVVGSVNGERVRNDPTEVAYSTLHSGGTR
jgi:polyisoprenyl-phosphate glycosyltransferase